MKNIKRKHSVMLRNKYTRYIKCIGHHQKTSYLPTRRSSDLPGRGAGERHRPHPDPPSEMARRRADGAPELPAARDRKSTRLNFSHSSNSYAVIRMKKIKKKEKRNRMFIVLLNTTRKLD